MRDRYERKKRDRKSSCAGRALFITDGGHGRGAGPLSWTKQVSRGSGGGAVVSTRTAIPKQIAQRRPRRHLQRLRRRLL